jgi:hypothetical protein
MAWCAALAWMRFIAGAKAPMVRCALKPRRPLLMRWP